MKPTVQILNEWWCLANINRPNRLTCGSLFDIIGDNLAVSELRGFKKSFGIRAELVFNITKIHMMAEEDPNLLSTFENHDVWVNTIFYQMQISLIVFSHKISLEIVDFLTYLITECLEGFAAICVDVGTENKTDDHERKNNLVPKQHYILHHIKQLRIKCK